MPARRSSSNGHNTRPEGDRRPVSETPADATAASADDVTADDPAGEDVTAEDVPMNRAARRAKGKKATAPRPVGKILPGRTNQSHGPRSYANRRSG
jgi:hypothetical protein